MTRLLALLVAVAASLTLAAPSLAARHDSLPLHPGSAGPRVAALQWLLAGHRPAAYRFGYLHTRPTGYFGRRTKVALRKTKWPAPACS
jgi:hypothetical protein